MNRLTGLSVVWVLVAPFAQAANSPEPFQALDSAIRKASEAGRLQDAYALRLKLAEQARAAGNFLQASRQYELLLSGRPSRVERVKLSIELGKVREALQDYRGAIVAYEDALHDDPKSFEGRLRLGRTYEQVDLYAPSENALRAAVKLNPSSAEPWLALGALYMKRGYLEKAVEAYTRARSLDASRQEATLGLADAYVRKTDLTQAEDLLRSASDASSSAAFQYRLGELYQRRRDLPNAQKAWETVLAAEPGDDVIRLKLALLYAHRGLHAESDREFARLLKARPDSPLLRFLRAWTLYGRGEKAEARTQALQAQRLSPTPLVRHFNEKLLEVLDRP